jgi:hypothetical protein
MTITYQSIKTLKQAEELRVIRNECAFAMTKDTSEITPERQETFFREVLTPGFIEAFLMYDDGNPVGYGLLIWDMSEHTAMTGAAWSSTGIKTSARGGGFGTKVTAENVRRAHMQGVPMWAEVRRDNAGQQKICYRIGYKLVSSFERDGVLIDLLRCDELTEDHR